jgi:hypothetical protein
VIKGRGLKVGAVGATGAGGAVSTGGDGVTGIDAAGGRALAHAATTTAKKGTDRRMLEAGREKMRAVARTRCGPRRGPVVYTARLGPGE